MASNGFVGFVTGALAGITAGILIAPDKGEKTRKRIKRVSTLCKKDIDKNINEQVDDLKDSINTFVDEMKFRFANLEMDIKQKEEEAQKKAAQKVEKGAQEVENKAKEARE
jgi:gas vesicle protein